MLNTSYGRIRIDRASLALLDCPTSTTETKAACTAYSLLILQIAIIIQPSIASGSQLCSPSCADLPIPASRKSSPITVRADSLTYGARLNTVA